jgi:hypothetical protein
VQAIEGTDRVRKTPQSPKAKHNNTLTSDTKRSRRKSPGQFHTDKHVTHAFAYIQAYTPPRNSQQNSVAILDQAKSRSRRPPGGSK